MASARIELAGLIGLPPGTQFTLVEPMGDQSKLAPLDTPVEKLEEIALANNADLREQFYNARIAANETRRALLKLLPGLSFDYGYNHDTDSYLINNSWAEASLRVSFNLFNILSGPAQMKAAKADKKHTKNHRKAQQKAEHTQKQHTQQQKGDAIHHFQRADDIAQV